MRILIAKMIEVLSWQMRLTHKTVAAGMAV